MSCPQKESATVLEHCDARKSEGQTTTKALTPSLAAAWRGVKRLACLLGCLFMALAALMFAGAPIEGDMSWSASVALIAVCGWVCYALYHIAESEDGGGGDV